MNASATVNRTVTIIVDILVVLVLFVVFLPPLGTGATAAERRTV